MTIAEKFMASINYMQNAIHHANVINYPELVLIFPNERELSYFEKGLKLSWDVNKFGLIDMDINNTRTLRINGLIIKLRVKANLPEDYEIVRK